MIFMKKFAIYQTPIGLYRIIYENNILYSLKKEHDEVLDFGEKNDFSEKVFFQLTEYLENKRIDFDVPYTLIGTDFQKKVWAALCEIPYGETRSYKEIATAVGNPKASRAVGLANNRNPIAIIVPCHRVIASDGKLTGYAGGLDVKEQLLKLEREQWR